MESDKSDEDEHEAISKQIVDYYRKYSQNKQLPKYFTGTSLSYMPQIVKEDEFVDKPLIIIEDTSNKPTEEVKVISPASSVTSNRKLEWDNGADIGYNNCEKGVKLHKSISLPTLTGSGDHKTKDKSAKVKLTSQVVTIISYTSPSDDYSVEKPIPSSSSSSSYPVEKPVVESSSSSGRVNPKPVSSSSSSSFATTLAFLKSKIGTPDAESTPKVNANYNETPCPPKKKKQGGHKVVDLCITKPILIECFGGKVKKVLDKRVQTSLIGGLSKCVQTGDSLGAISEDQVQRPKQNQSVIIITYDSTNTQISSDIGSQCDSFKYYQKQDADQLKRSRAKSDLVASSNSSNSNEIPLLGQLITEKQSKSLVGDIDKSIAILQKLLKSKKYDPVTKKRYIKKIVEKIVDNNYSGDSTTSSELFLPKRDQQQKLQDNVPWYPVKMSKLTVKTFSDEFLPNGDENTRKKSPFTISEPRDSPSSSLERQNSSSGSYPSWKDDKTLSERLLEENQRGQGDHLVKFAMKERQHQLAWINDEISHLTKLRGLLDRHEVQRTTTVYMVSDVNKATSSQSSNSKNSARNYVIQTEISPTTSSEVSDFNLRDQNGQKNYQVKAVVAKSNGEKNEGKLVGDIEVVSDENTTSIKVKTRKLETDNAVIKLKDPVLIGGGKYDTFPRSHAEEERCWPCGVIKSRRDGIAGLGRQQHPYEVPKHTTSLIKKVDEIMSKYSSKASIDNKCRCNEMCVCCKKGGDTYRKSSKESTSSGDVEPKTVTRYVCSCKNQDSALQTDCVCKENAKAQTEDCACSNKQVQTNKSSSESDSESDSESTSKTTSSSTGTVHSCVCCKRKNVKAKTLYALKKKLSDKAYPLCRPCYRQNQRRGYTHNMYCNPTHVCNCYTVVETKTLNDIKDTINDLKELDEQYCSCTSARSRETSDYCQYCNCKLKKTSRNKNGIAYMLTFEDETIQKEKKKKQPYLEEIKIKIPTTHKNKKKHKDKENKRKKESRSHSVDSEENSTSEGRKGNNYNLQEYLVQNRPDFVQVAEDRRKSVVGSKVHREEMADHNKLQFLHNYMEKNTEKNPKRIFSAKEMREITRKNYQKLPEVQQKLSDNRVRQIRQASRLMADIFNKKLRENVLKGKRSLPTDVNLVNL